MRAGQEMASRVGAGSTVFSYFVLSLNFILCSSFFFIQRVRCEFEMKYIQFTNIIAKLKVIKAVNLKCIESIQPPVTLPETNPEDPGG